MKVGMWKHLNWTFPISVTLRPCWLTFVTLRSVAELTRDLFLSHIRPTGKRSGAVKFTSACVRDRQAGCLKVIMAFNLSQRWFIWAWQPPKPQTWKHEMKTITLEVSSVTLNFLNVEKKGKWKLEKKTLYTVFTVDLVQFDRDLKLCRLDN